MTIRLRAFPLCTALAALACGGIGSLHAAPAGGAVVIYRPDADWKPVDMASINIKPGSALDLSGWVEPGPAGRQGRLIARADGTLVFEKEPAREVRFLGFNLMCPQVFRALNGASDGETKANLREFAALVRRQGYNVVRFSGLDFYLMTESGAARRLSPRQLDNFEYLFAELKKQGVYLYLDLASFGLFYPGTWTERIVDRNMKAEVSAGLADTRENWRAGARELLMRVNRHTGTRLAEDPALICVNFYNEQEHGYLKMKGAEGPALRKQWQDWLRKKYGSPEALAAAWGESGVIASFDSLPLEHPYRADARGNDYGEFLHSVDKENLEWYVKTVREAGYAGLYTQYDISAVHRYGLLRASMPVASMHGYHAHGTLFTRPGATCDQRSSIADAGFYWRYICGTRLLGRPFMVTEHNHGFWNQYQHEGGLLFSAYSALQNFEAVMIHENAVALKAKDAMHDFSVANSPVVRANEFLAACLYLRGDVAPSKHRVEIRLRPDDVRANWNRATNLEQTKLGLLSRFGLAFGDAPAPGADLPAADLSPPPAAGATVQATEWESSSVSTWDPDFSLADTVAEMRDLNILPPGNRTDPSAGVFESDTGEITLWTRSRELRVLTARSEAATLEPGGRARLGVVDIESASVACALAVVSVDGRPLAESDRAVLVVSTQNVNTGMVLSADRFTLHEKGELPALLRTGVFRLSLRHSKAASLQLWSLGLDGSRRERIPVTVADGCLRIELDTSALRDATPFFEIVALDRKALP